MKVSRVGCFGKIPAQGDFVRHHAEPFAFAGLDRWLTDGLAILARTGTEMRPSRFLYFAGGAALGGVLVPSRDRVGRRFPLAIFVVLAEVPDLAVLAPLLLAEFVAAADAVGDVAVRGLDLSALRQHVDSLRGVAAEVTAREHLASYCRTKTLPGFGEEVLGQADLAMVRQWLTNLRAAAGNADPPHYALRSLVADDAPWLSAWLRTVRALSPHALQFALWDRVGPAGVATFRMVLDQMAARYAGPMLDARSESELIYDVTPKDGGAVPDGPAADFVGAMVGDGLGSLEQVLGRAKAGC